MLPARSTATTLLALALLAACGGGEARRSVLLVVTDTVRADKLGCYGNPRQLTPHIDRLAGEGLRFANASSHAPWTLPSIATMLTGLHPKEHGAGGRLGRFTALAAGIETLPGAFAAEGYRTHCVANVEFLNAWTGVTREFGSVDLDAPTDNQTMRSAERTTDAALAWLDAGDEPFFLLVHYFDPHAVYNPPQPFRSRFAAEQDREGEPVTFPSRQQVIDIRAGRGFPPEDLIRRAERLHEGEIAYMDAQIGRLLAGLDARGLAAGTIVALTADHGEEFLEHGGFEHGHQLYQELTHVPLILRAPGLTPGVIEPTVAHVDLAATLCELADLAPPEQFLHAGRSLLDTARDPTQKGRPVLAHGNMWAEPLTSWRIGDEKLIRRTDGSFELYHLAADPGEQRDLAAARPARVEALAEGLRQVEGFLRATARGEEVELSEAARKALIENGYIGGEDD